MIQSKNVVCPQCGKPLASELPGSACPQCLMALAMNGGTNAATAAAYPGALDQGHVPPIETLVSEFPNLEIQHLIGHGGMGAVYQARQINLDRVVALKILSPRLSCDPAFAERFLREARTLAKLAHPNIVTIFDFGRAGSYYYLTMEFVDGVNLRDTISAKLLTTTEALAIVPQVCEALQYAHDHGVVHRDIKPENILIAKNGNLKIADFGLAKLLQATSDDFTLTGTCQVLGTRNYMAPEQIESPERVDHRADLYSLGVVFYELLTGELPLGRFSLPSEKSACVSNLLDDVVMRTLQKDPDRRYQQASQIKTACKSIETPVSNRAFQADSTRTFGSDSIPICRPFPIKIEEIYAGLASGFGMLRGFESHLDLEYEVRDSVVDHKWAAAKVQIPLERISAIRFYKGLIYTYIEIQADRFEVVSAIPNSKSGAFRVYLKKENRDAAGQLVDRVNEIINDSPNPPFASPKPPVKQGDYLNAYRTDNKTNDLLAGVLVFLFVGACVVFALAVVLGSIWMSSAGPQPSINVTPSRVATSSPNDDTNPVAEPTPNQETTSESGPTLDAESIKKLIESNPVAEPTPNQETTSEPGPTLDAESIKKLIESRS